MFLDTIDVRVKGRDFRIEGTPVINIVEEIDVVYYVPRVFEDDVLLNDRDMPHFANGEDAVQYGFEFVKDLVRKT